MRPAEARILAVNHQAQRYDTVGDWFIEAHDGVPRIFVQVSRLDNWRMELACGMHELIEAALCYNDGVSEENVTRFDKLYEARRQMYLDQVTLERVESDKQLKDEFGCDCTPTEDSEPGEDVHAPYRKQHAFADGIERLVANALGVKWDEYSQKVAALEYTPSTEGSIR